MRVEIDPWNQSAWRCTFCGKVCNEDSWRITAEGDGDAQLIREHVGLEGDLIVCGECHDQVEGPLFGRTALLTLLKMLGVLRDLGILQQYGLIRCSERKTRRRGLKQYSKKAPSLEYMTDSQSDALVQ